MTDSNVIQFVPRANLSRDVSRVDCIVEFANQLRNEIDGAQLLSPRPFGEFPYVDTTPSDYVAPSDDCA